MPVVMKLVFSMFLSIMCMLNTNFTRDGIYSVRSFLCMWPKNENNLKICEKVFRATVSILYSKRTQKEHAEIKLGKIDAHLEASARKSLVHFTQQMAISASIA